MRAEIAALLIAALGAACEAPVAGLDPNSPDPSLPEPGESFDPVCSTCHGGDLSPAPPQSLSGTTETTDMGVGAHRSHLAVTEASTWHAPILCANCHMVPAEVSSPGHMDDGDNKAELTFGELARTGGLAPALNPDGTCSNVYCHGATLSGGTVNQPLWTQVDGSQRQCGTCHGAPPPAPHPDDPNCGNCHPTMEPGSPDTFLDPSKHIDGIVEMTSGAAGECDSCHGSDGLAAPPKDLAGNTDRASLGVGAHRQHLGTSDWRREINCSNCHVVPLAVDDPGHMDGDNIAEVPFDSLNPVAAVDLATGTCTNLYCHGNGRASNGTMTWTSTTPMACGSCHITPQPGQSASGMSGAHDLHIRRHRLECVECHDTVVDAGRDILKPQLHVDGQRNVHFARGGNYDAGNRRCSNLACHGSESWGGGD